MCKGIKRSFSETVDAGVLLRDQLSGTSSAFSSLAMASSKARSQDRSGVDNVDNAHEGGDFKKIKVFYKVFDVVEKLSSDIVQTSASSDIKRAELVKKRELVMLLLRKFSNSSPLCFDEDFPR